MTGSVHRAGVSPAPSDAEQSAFVHGAFADSSGSTAIVAALDDAGLSVIGEAARGSGNVTALVLVAAYVLDEGKSIATALDPGRFTGGLIGPRATVQRPLSLSARSEPAAARPAWHDLPSWALVRSKTTPEMDGRARATVGTIPSSHAVMVSQPADVVRHVHPAPAEQPRLPELPVCGGQANPFRPGSGRCWSRVTRVLIANALKCGQCARAAGGVTSASAISDPAVDRAAAGRRALTAFAAQQGDEASR